MEGQFVWDMEGQSEWDMEGQSVWDMEGQFVRDIEGQFVLDMESQFVWEIQGQCVWYYYKPIRDRIKWKNFRVAWTEFELITFWLPSPSNHYLLTHIPILIMMVH